MKRLFKAHPAFRETALYGTATLLSQAISAFRGLVIASMLGPSSYGLWKSIQVPLDWLSYTHFGILHGMARRIPVARKAGDEEEVSAARAVGIRAALLTAIGAGGLLVGGAWLGGWSPWIWGAVALLLVPTQAFKHLHMICLAEGRFGTLSSANLALAIFSLLAMFLLVPRFGVYGVLLGLGAGYGVALLAGANRSIFRLTAPSTPLWPLARRLASVGFPFMAVDGLFVVWQRLDRLVLIPYYGAESRALGCYGLATMVASFAIQIPQIVTRVLFRRTVSALDDTGVDSVETQRLRRRHLEIPCLLVATLSPIVLSLGALASWGLVALLLPDYSVRNGVNGVGSEESIALLLLACYGCGVGLSFRNIYTATDRQWRLAAIYGVACLATILPPLMLIEGGGRADAGGIRWAAWGMLAGSTIFALMAAFDCHRWNGSGGREMLRTLATILGPFVVYGGWTLWALERLDAEGGTFGTPGGWMVLLLSTLALHTPIAVYGAFRVLRWMRTEG